MIRFAICFGYSLVLISGLSAADSTTDQLEPKAKTIQDLIEQLGSPDYATREYAEQQLEKTGYQAFEPLRAAQEHDDIEIRYRVQRLLHNLRGKLILGGVGDSILKDYETRPEVSRAGVIEYLSLVRPDKSIPILCRLARFEESEVLSKKAALVVITQELPKDSEPTFIKRINDSVGASQRTCSDWLRVYAQSLANPADAIDQWEKISDTEATLYKRADEATSADIVHGIVRAHVAMLVKANRPDDALELADERLNRPSDVLELVEMFLQNKSWSVIEKQLDKHDELFETDRFLAYRKAEYLRAKGDEEAAGAQATKAFEIGKKNDPRPNQATEGDKICVEMTARWPVPQTANAFHMATGLSLSIRGMHDWAKSEYQEAISQSKVGDIVDAQTRLLLSEMLHDQAQDSEAGEALKPLVDGLKTNPTTRRVIASLRHSPAGVTARMHFFIANGHLRANEIDKAQDEIEKAIAAEPSDADVLIALHRFPRQNEAWEKRTHELINSASKAFRRKIAQYSVNLERTRTTSSTLTRTLEGDLADQLNQFAWLVGNTQGDIEEAIRNSERSLELRPGAAGYLDTLARCYYRGGRLDEAIETQRQAVRRDPYSGQINDQLKLFLDSKKAKTGE